MKSNLLGDIRAEHDRSMLNAAFYETEDYKTLVSSSDRNVIVGRRGTGKSALVYRLEQFWSKESRVLVLNLSPEETQLIGLRSTFQVFGEEWVNLRAASKVAWKFAILMQVLEELKRHYKLEKYVSDKDVDEDIKLWKRSSSMTGRLRKRVSEVVDKNQDSEANVADLADGLNLPTVEHAVRNVLSEREWRVVVLVDRLDEGYSPDEKGVALVDGLVQAVIDLNSHENEIMDAFVFLRDNIYRSIANKDPDFSRNVEGQVIRLHWDDYSLFNLVCNRLRISKDIEKEKTESVWNQSVANDLKGRKGFRGILKLTLYRPRDILALLNHAFFISGGNQIIPKQVEEAADSISENRLKDLHKEYESLFPSLPIFTQIFSGGKTEYEYTELREKVQDKLDKGNRSPEIRKDLSIIESPIEIVQRLYAVGFLGLYEESEDRYIFCHDGRDPSKEVVEQSRLLVHPCYWIALNLEERGIEASQAEEIYDEYDIEVSSITKEQRESNIGHLLAEIGKIDLGQRGFSDFEEWSLRAIEIVFAGALTNFELHPNGTAVSRRDVVALNPAEKSVWKRIYDDYGVRHVVFEIKNFEELEFDNYRQMASYLNGQYGRLGFIVCRAKDNNLRRDKELSWVRHVYHEQGGKLIIKISEKFLTKFLSKARNPQKHDEVNKEVQKLIDQYERKWLSVK